GHVRRERVAVQVRGQLAAQVHLVVGHAGRRRALAVLDVGGLRLVLAGRLRVAPLLGAGGAVAADQALDLPLHRVVEARAVLVAAAFHHPDTPSRRAETSPSSDTRTSSAGCRAVAGPCTTEPSPNRNTLPCHGQVTHGSPSCRDTSPSCSGPPRWLHWSAS